MKRILFGLGFSLTMTAISASAQDSRPAASFGRPIAPTAITPEIQPAAAAIDFFPKAMPKGTVNEVPSLPMPTPAPGINPIPALGINPIPAPMPGVITSPPSTGPSLVPPGTPSPVFTDPMPYGPVPGGPVMVRPPVIPGTVVNGPIVATPMGSCNSPLGCTSGISGLYSGMPVPVNNWYFSGEYLLWWLKGYIAPPLATVSPVSSQGIIGQPGTVSIFPTERINNNPMSGGRFSLGYWFSPKWAIETNFFFVHDTGDSFGASSAQYPNSVLARPFFSLNQNRQFAEQIGNPGIYSGYIDVRYKSSLYGIDLNLRKHLYESCTTKVDLLVGARMLDLGDELIIQENVQGLANAPAQFVGQNKLLTDSFKTKNQFYGGQVGAIFNHNWGRWNFNATGKIALGGSVMTSSVSGGVVSLAGPAPNLPGGLLALKSNISDVTATKLAYVPEVNLNLGYDLTSHTRIFVGYSFLYWSTVARPGAQIDPALNEYLIPDFTTGRNPPATTSPRPLNVVQRESFWAQGINFGLQFRW